MTVQALIIIDVQNDYFKNGKMELHEPEIALENILKLEAQFIQKEWPIFYIQHTQSLAPDRLFFEGTYGAENHAKLACENQTNGFNVIKHFPNSFHQTELQHQLKALSVQKLIITGMMTNMCVDATTRAALDLGYEVDVIADATAARALSYASKEVNAVDVKTAFLAALNFLTNVKSTQEYLDSIDLI
ncbi:hypothetical protein B9T31_16415 [Acinetobacter sp. ANC 4558]|uniref:cysteine hydrolase family protein n=1 Tax=Acinetobacter sp. ANC 4558 TaxID=1977876 RepID=UPI000A340CDD|nr:cysteine hydrolase family protein [Acinetobacter sp. ANC 4558]OTG80092.1 hypothetical protein B9T31_16415 [Acinetobacter sp. ANC 4558]